MSSAFADRAARIGVRLLWRRTLRLSGDRPVVSVTFDDVLASAATTGAAILEAHGCRGTFYVAGGLTGGREAGRCAHEQADLQRLRNAGHQLASHGWGHVDYTRLSPRALVDDLWRNQAFLGSSDTPDGPVDFAYPFGRHDRRTKRRVREYCRSARVLGNGLHRGQADLNRLGSCRFYGAGRDPSVWRAWLDALRPGCWLIVNTHEVEDDCGPYGCTPAELARFVSAALACGSRVLPVSAAIAYFEGQPG